MIENFTAQQFEAALPAGKWANAGICPKSHQRMYTVTPTGCGAFAILVYSSILASGASDKAAGKDSIRCRITMNGQRYGGKPVRWVDRRPGWQKRLRSYLDALKNQILWLLALPCPHCGGTLTPFTSRNGKEENKGRAFVCCKNPKCPGLAGKPDGAISFLEWCENDDKDNTPIPPPTGSVKPPVVQGPPPACPNCAGPMVRMTKGVGWRCAIKGNRFERGQWSLCNGVIWDKAAKSDAISAAIGSTLTAEQQTQALMADLEGGDGEPVQAPRSINLSEKREQRRQGVQGFTVDAYSLRTTLVGAVNELRRLQTSNRMIDPPELQPIIAALHRLLS